MKTIPKLTVSLATSIGAALAFSAVVQAHHSFAMYNLQKTQVFTGVVTRVDPAPNHLQIFFAPMNDERKNVIRDESGEPVVWSVEMQGSSQAAREGISVSSFPRGTIFSVGLHPLRNGDTAGTREGGIFKCPEGTPPAAGMHCDSVAGHEAIGDEGLPTPTE
ncbi:MAG: DUF6152 family protein [Gammaproteobacteria bacterium]|jgi:hypothetical protein